MALTAQEINEFLGLAGDGAAEETDAGTAGTSNEGPGGEAANENVPDKSGASESADADEIGGGEAADTEASGAGERADAEAVGGGEASDEKESGEAAQPDTQGTGETSKDNKEKLTEEQIKANAARRRKHEAQIAEAKAVETAVAAALAAERAKQQAELNEFFAGAQLQNPLSGTPIKSMEEYKEWQREHSAAQMRHALEEGRLTPELLDRAIAESPALKRAEEAAARADEERRQREAAEFKARADAEIAEIGKLNPAVKGIEDILAMPTGSAFREHVRRGCNFIDAYRLANWERLTQSAASAAAQQAVSNARSKDHLTSTQTRGGGGLEIPDGAKEIYKFLNPGDTEADMHKHYERYGKKLAAG